MASQEEWDRIICESKVRFAKLKGAERALKEIADRKGVLAEGMTPYRCHVCSAYHLGHPKGTRKQLREKYAPVLGKS